jgi:transposase-like protein
MYCTQEPVGQEVEQQARSTSRSSVSRTFIERTRRSLSQLMSRRLDDVRLAVMMIDGIDLGERTNVVALGVTTEGVKIPLGLWEGSTENAAVATALLSDLVARGLDPEQGILFVIDGARALRKAIRTVFGDAPVQRCVRHKERNVTDHLPERERPAVKQRLRRAWALDDHQRALEQLKALASELDRSYPGAAGSLREGVEETLTLTRLGVSDNLKRTLASTNPCESMIEIVRGTQRNVKRWSSGEMALRWTAAGMLEAERQFRKIIGYRELATLVVAIERGRDRRRQAGAAHAPTEEAAIVLAS